MVVLGGCSADEVTFDSVGRALDVCAPGPTLDGIDVSKWQGHIDWAAVRKELAAIDFTGWATCEVKGGDRDRLRQVVERMDQVLGIES